MASRKALAAGLAAAIFVLAGLGPVASAAKPHCRPAWKCPPPSATATPTASSPSGYVALFSDEFSVDRAAGTIGGADDPNYYAYWTWPDTYRKGNGTGGGIYTAANLSVHDGYADVRLKGPTVTGGAASVVAFGPRQGWQLYGRYDITFEVLDATEGFKLAWLLWPTSEVWPRDGEIDFPEGNLTGNISAFMHRQGATVGSDQDAYETAIPVVSGIHSASVEWMPNSLKFILDGAVIGHSTARVPNTPMRWIIQSETRLDSVRPAVGSEARIRIYDLRVWDFAG